MQHFIPEQVNCVFLILVPDKTFVGASSSTSLYLFIISKFHWSIFNDLNKMSRCLLLLKSHHIPFNN